MVEAWGCPTTSGEPRVMIVHNESLIVCAAHTRSIINVSTAMLNNSTLSPTAVPPRPVSLQPSSPECSSRRPLCEFMRPEDQVLCGGRGNPPRRRWPMECHSITP